MLINLIVQPKLIIHVQCWFTSPICHLSTQSLKARNQMTTSFYRLNFHNLKSISASHLLHPKHPRDFVEGHSLKPLNISQRYYLMLSPWLNHLVVKGRGILGGLENFMGWKQIRVGTSVGNGFQFRPYTEG